MTQAIATLDNAFIARGLFLPYSATNNPVDALCFLLAARCARTGERPDPKSIREARAYCDELVTPE